MLTKYQVSQGYAESRARITTSVQLRYYRHRRLSVGRPCLKLLVLWLNSNKVLSTIVDTLVVLNLTDRAIPSRTSGAEDRNSLRLEPTIPTGNTGTDETLSSSDAELDLGDRTAPGRGWRSKC